MNAHNDIILPFFNLFYSSIKVHCEKVAAMLKFWGTLSLWGK